MKLVLILAVILNVNGKIHIAAGLNNLGLSLVDYEVRKTTAYTITFSPTSAIPSTAIVKIILPIECSIQTSSTYSCSLSNFFATPTSSSCTSDSSTNSVTVTGFFSGGAVYAGYSFPFTITLNAVTNPRSDKPTDSIQISITNSAGTVIDSDSSSTDTIVIATSCTMASSSISVSSNTIGATAVYTFTYTPTYTSVAGSVIQVKFPYWNSVMNPVGNNLKQMVTTTSPVCTGVTNIAASLTCSYNTNALILKISNGFSVDTSGAVSFSVASVTNPPNANPVSGFIIYMRDLSDYNFESSISMSVSVSTPNSISINGVSANPKTVSTSTTIDINFNVKNPMTANFIIEVTVPPEITFDTSMTVIGVSTVKTGLLARTITGTKIRITNGYSAYSATALVWFQLTLMTNPSSTQPSSAFTVTTYTDTGLAIDTGSGGALTSTPGALTANGANAFITASSSVVGVLTTYNIEFMIKNSLPSGAALMITFPIEISPTARSATVCTNVITNFNAAGTCAVTSQVLTVIGGFPNGLVSLSAVKFGLNQITNPLSTAPSSSFTITTYTSSSLLYQIDTLATGIVFTAISGSLVSVVVTPSSDVVGSITTYNFKITTKTIISTGGKVTVNFPSGVSITDPSSATNNCLKVSGFNSGTFACAVTSSSVTINTAFNSGSFSPGLLEFTIGYVMNPISTKSVQSFTVTTYDSNNYVIDLLSTGIAVQVNTMNTLTAASASISSTINGASTTYTFSVTPKTSTPASSIVLIVPPSTVTFPSTPVCSPVSALVSSVVCSIQTLVNLQAVLTLTSAASSGSVISFTVTNVINPPTTQPSTSFKFYTYTSDNYGIDHKETGVTIATTTAASLQNVLITPSDSKIAVSSSYTVNYVPINSHPIGTVVTILVPAEFTIGVISCSSILLSSLTCVSSGSSVVTSGFQSEITSASNLDIKITGITNPTTLLTTSAWAITSRTGSYLIDTSTSVTSTFTCGSPCLTCATTATTCISCSSSGLTPYLYSSTCNAQCPSGQVDDTGTAEKVCVNCNSLCKTCKDTPTFCLSCNPGANPYLYSNTCNAICLQGYYGDGSTCIQCSNPCLTCTSATACSSCTISNTAGDNFGKLTYLSGTTCVFTCPTGYLANTETKTCDFCDSSCATCSGSTTTCTSCPSGKFLLGSTCISSCPSDGTYLVSGSSCLPCTSPCKTCSGSVTTCATCNANYVLHSATCLGACPSGYVDVSGVCTACKAPCATCITSISICVTCVSPTVLYSTACLDACPGGYVSDGLKCVSCDSSCSTCTNSATICTSCTNGLNLHNSACISNCPAGTTVAIAGVCQPCIGNCATCSASTNFCMTCTSGYRLYKNTCISSCAAGTTLDTGTTCLDCNTNCATCSGTVDTCATCASGKYIQGTVCVDSCSGNYILSGGKCLPCDSVCFSCSTTTTSCTQCISNYYMLNNYCYNACPQNYIVSNGKCVEVVPVDCNTGCTAALLANNGCDTVCRVAACNYDNGMCVGPTSCLDGEYQVGNTCLTCSTPCNKCTAPSTCTTCYVDGAGKQWLLNQVDSFCYETCPDGTFKNSLVCTACDLTCKTCSGNAATCLTCATGLLLYNNQCLAKCIDFLTVQVGNTCVACDSNCYYCSTTSTTCTSCKAGHVLQGTVCQISCNTGYITTSSSPNTCVACQSCATCTGSVTSCLTCVAPLYLYNSQCFASCPDGTYHNGNICSSCDSSCVTCTSILTCTACATGKVKYGSLCLSSCPAGYQATNSVCEVIPPAVNCATSCTSALLNNLDCDQECNYLSCNYDNLHCKPQSSDCPAGQYYSGSTCVSCVSPCLTCSSASTCYTCGADSGGNTLYLYNNYCYPTCPSTTMANGIICQKCDSSCAECAVSTTTCIKCPSSFFLYQGTCVSACPSLSTVALGTICEACSSNCKTCVGSVNTCTACTSPLVLQGSLCQPACNSGFTLTTASPSVCVACTSNCATCSGTTSTCFSCTGSYYLYQSNCISNCPSKLTVLVGSTCVDCVSPCAECAGLPNTCTLCASGYALSGSACLLTCPSGYEAISGVCNILCSDGCYAANLKDTVCQPQCNTLPCNSDNGACVKPLVCDQAYQYQSGSTCIDCVYPCNTCSSASYCLSCRASTVTTKQLYIYSGTCYDDCPTKTYLSGIVCIDCSSSCATCSGSATTCLTCTSPLKLYKGTCISACPVGTTVEITGTCWDCSNTCSQCSGLTTTCTSCPNGTVLSSGTCIASCPAGKTTTSVSAGACVDCSSTCSTCLGSTTSCTSCSGSKLLYQSTCVDNCPSGYTKTLADPTVCTACISSCLECTETTSKCTSCFTGYKVTAANTCQANTVQSCPDGYTLTAASAFDCFLCASPCTKCSGSVSYCTDCSPPLLASSGNCVTCTSPCVTCSLLPTVCNSCIQGYFISGTNCVLCASPCFTCSGSSNSCLTCIPGYYLSGTSCIKCVSNCLTCGTSASQCTSCDTGKFLESNQCVGCDPSCLTCEGSSIRCTTCAEGLFLTNTYTCSPCSSTCKTCLTSPTFCLSCNGAKTLINNVCGICDSVCATCSTSFSVCDTCASGLTKIGSTCGTCNSNCATCITDFNTCGSCASGQYLLSGACKPCKTPCKTCSGAEDFCTSCNSPYNLFTSSCQLCDVTCATCSGNPSTCTSCAASLTLIGSACLQCTNDCLTCAGTTGSCLSCNNGYYLQGSSCLLCSSSCLTCSLSSKNCISCPLGSNLASGNCYYTCTDGYALIGTACVPCDANCKTCAGTIKTCTSCHTGFIYNSQCISTCPAGYYYTGTTCSVCSSNCKTCSALPTTCLSCETGYTLSSSTCKMICQNGQFYLDNLCYPCDSTCLTCVTSSTNCLSCPKSNQVVSAGTCIVPCDAGYVRNTATGLCEKCNSACLNCAGSVNTCTTCANSTMVLYSGSCLIECPVNITVNVNNICNPCTAPCGSCSGVVTNCTSCTVGSNYYANTCVNNCPTGYKAEYQVCVKCERPDCSNTTNNSTNNNTNNCTSNSTYNCTDNNNTNNNTNSTNTTEYAANGTTFTAKPVPFPFSIGTGASAAAIGVTKLTAAGVNFVPSLISVWGLSAAGSWIFLGAYLPNEGQNAYSNSRRLATMLDPTSGGNIILSICLIVIVVALAFHLMCNIVYTTGFLLKTWSKDSKFKFWRKQHPVAAVVISCLSYCISFHSIRLYYCSMCNQPCFKAEFDHIGNIKKGLVKYGYISLFCTHFPMIAAQALLLIHFGQGYWMWMFSLDSLIITVFLTLFIFYDIIKIDKDLLRVDFEKDSSIEDDGEKLIDPLKELIDHFPSLDLSGMIPSRMPRHKLKKMISKSVDDEGTLLPKLKRSHSFPKLDLEGIEIRPEEFRVHSEPNIIQDEPFAEEIVDDAESIKASSFIEEPTMIVEEPVIEIPRHGEIYSSSMEYKSALYKEILPKFTPFNLDPRTEEFTEIIAFTEEDSYESEAPPVKEEEEPNMEDLEIIQDLESTIKQESHESEHLSDVSEHLGTINEENELELEKAIADIENPEIITVPHIETGRRIKLKKDFKGARVVDLENKVIETFPPVDETQFDIPKTVVDEEDVRFATLTDHRGSKVRVKRNFKGARIIDLEKRVTNPNGFLIGKSVEHENEFQFQAAYPDPEDPEVVVVTHKETGEDVKVRKTFHDAFEVDDKGLPVPNSRPINRNDYDIPRTIVDKEDVHLATLSHKQTKARVRVRRDFKGAKIVDLEKKSEVVVPKRKKITHITEKSEPEPLSPDLSDLEYIPFPAEEEEEEDYEIPRIRNIPRPKMSAGRERLADLAKIISEESKGMHSPMEDPYNIPGIDSDEDLDFMPEPEVPHYRDLDDDFDNDFMSRGASVLEDSESFSTLRGAGRKRGKKRGKKFRPADAFRMKGLEEIYLERQGVKKKPLRNKFSEDILEPDMEIEDYTGDSAFDNYRAPLEKAGEEIVRGRNRW